MRNTNPEDKVGDIDAPAHRMRQARHAKSSLNLVHPGVQTKGQDNQIAHEKDVPHPVGSSECLLEEIAVDLAIAECGFHGYRYSRLVGHDPPYAFSLRTTLFK